MASKYQSLCQLYPRSLDIPLGLFAAAVFLVLGIFLPVITLKEMVFWKHTFSILSGIVSLWEEGHYFLSLIILLFSIIFTFLKMVMLFSLWFKPMSQDDRLKSVKWMSEFGKWSMLDVFVVAVTIVIAKISQFASAQPKIGIYFFCCSILLAIFITMRIEKQMQPK